MKKKEKHFSSDSLNPWTTFSYMSQSISFDYFSKLVFFFNQKNPNTISLCPSLYLTEPQDIEIFFQNHLSIQYLGSWSPASLPITSSQFCFPGLWSPLSHLILIFTSPFLDSILCVSLWLSCWLFGSFSNSKQPIRSSASAQNTGVF